jgi:predicted GTPase
MKVRIAVMAALFLAPWVFLIGVGSYWLWKSGWFFYAWWPMLLCFALAYFLAWRWTRKGANVLPPTETDPPNYWTDRDKLAYHKVTAKAKTYEKITSDQLTDPKHYSDVALDLVAQVAEVYNPGASNPFDHLTIPEILACAELASADLDELVQKYVPGAHMFRIRDMKRAREAVGWYNTGRNLMWAGSAIINPLQTGLRYLASQAALGSMVDRLQGNVMLWFHTAYIHHLGHYLVELNSGRLKVGVKRYREILAQHGEPVPPTEPAPAADVAAAAPGTLVTTPPAARPIGIAVLGPVKAGKSSLVNALVGKQSATVDTLPVPHVGTRYAFTLEGGQPVSILDTAGYGQDGPNEAEFLAATEAAQQADLILFVTAATHPGRKPDVEFLDRLRAWFAARPQLKLPPVIAAVNQVDLLSPKAEWKPPYDWVTGTRAKEANIRDCVAAVREQLGERAVEYVPVCARENETFNVRDGLVPAVAALLDDARGAAVLKAFDAEAAADQIKKLGRQLVAGGKAALGVLWQNLRK